MINHGWLHVEKQYEHGDISAKGYNIIKNKVALELEGISTIGTLRPPESSESLSDMLDQVSLFDALGSEDRLDLENHATDITFLAGDTIVGESEKGDNFYILRHGTAAVLKLNEDGSSEQITEFNDGDIIGESSLLEQEKRRHRRSATIVARTACNLVSITRKAMLSIVEKYPDIRQQLQTIHDERIGGAEQPATS